MLFLTWYMLIPLLFVLACMVQAWRRPGTFWRRAGIYGLFSYLVAFVIGIFAIFESRSSTASVGLLFLPMIALIPGLLAFVFGAAHFHLRQADGGWRQHPWPLTIILLAGLILAGVYGYQGYGWHQTANLNSARDQEAERQRQAMKENRRELAQRLAAAPGREAEIIDRLSQQTGDRTWLIPLAANPHASAQTLDRLSRSADLGVALSALRHVNLSTAAIVRVYREHSYPDYFFSTMAGNANSPAWLLHELFQKRAQNLGIELALAENPSTPVDVIDALLAGADQRILSRLARNPGLDCGQASEVKVRLEDDREKRRGSPLANRLSECEGQRE